MSAKYILDHDYDDIDNRLTLGIDYRNIGYYSDSADAGVGHRGRTWMLSAT